MTEADLPMTAPPDRKWPVGLYAPGTYWCKCAKCGQSHLADKRAQHCADCTIQDLVAAIAAAEVRGREQAATVLDTCAAACDRAMIGDVAYHNRDWIEMRRDAFRYAAGKVRALIPARPSMGATHDQ